MSNNINRIEKFFPSDNGFPVSMYFDEPWFHHIQTPEYEDGEKFLGLGSKFCDESQFAQFTLSAVSNESPLLKVTVEADTALSGFVMPPNLGGPVVKSKLEWLTITIEDTLDGGYFGVKLFDEKSEEVPNPLNQLPENISMQFALAMIVKAKEARTGLCDSIDADEIA